MSPCGALCFEVLVVVCGVSLSAIYEITYECFQYVWHGYVMYHFIDKGIQRVDRVKGFK